MDRAEFIKAIMERHKVETNPVLLVDDYKIVMSENVDFDDLFSTYLHEYTMSKPPAPAWFAQRLKYKNKIESNKDDVVFDSVYAIIRGIKYEFGYNPKTKNEEFAKREILKIDENAKFIDKKEYYGYQC